MLDISNLIFGAFLLIRISINLLVGYHTIRQRGRVVYERIVNEAKPS